MSGKLHHSFRQGNLAEGIALEAFRTFALVVPVPRTEDVGLDALATLLRRDGSLLYPEDSFFLQVKSIPDRSKWSHTWTDPEVDWLRKLELPLFLAAVVLSESAIYVYSMNAVYTIFARDSAAQTLTVRLGHDPESTVTRDCRGDVYLGRPVLRLSIGELAGDQAARERACQVLSEHARREGLNRKIRDAGLVYWWCRGIMSPEWPWNRERPGSPDDTQLQQFGQPRLSRSVLMQMGYLMPALEAVVGHNEIANLLIGTPEGPVVEREVELLTDEDLDAIEKFGAFLERRHSHPLPQGRE